MDVQEIYNCFLEKDIKFYTGVPDSLLKDICFYIEDNTDRQNHIIAANEGNAIGIALGYHLSTGKVPLVYFQNSGLGNCINPLLSLADKEVYAIPMIIMIGWYLEYPDKCMGDNGHRSRISKSNFFALYFLFK